MRKSSGAPENLIPTAGFYNSRGLSDEKIPPGGPEILIVAAGFYISKCPSDEKIPGGPESLIAAA